MGALVWSPLGQGLLTGRYRKGEETDPVRAGSSSTSATSAGSTPSSG